MKELSYREITRENINFRNEEGLLPIHLALIDNTDLNVIKRLIDLGADLEADLSENYDVDECTFLDVSAEIGLAAHPLQLAVSSGCELGVINALLTGGADIEGGILESS